jgi:hypothetical protein
MGTDRPWWRYLDCDDQPLYLIGNICDTCEAVFGLAGESQYALAPAEIGEMLRSSMDKVPQPFVDSMVKILPNGKYLIGLISVKPALQESPAEEKTTSNLQKPPDRAYQHMRRPDYYWTMPGENWQELFLPILAKTGFDAQQVDFYRRQIEAGTTPTALAFTLMDRRTPAGRYIQHTIAHFLLDGHHKMMAASLLNAPIKLLSCINISESFAGEEDVLWLVKRRY